MADDDKDDQIEDQDPPVDDEDTDDDADDGDDDGPKQTEAEKKLAKALAAARRERNEARKALAEARKAASKAKDDDEGDSKAADEAVTQLETRLVRQAALTELTGAGLTREQAKRAVNLLDLDGVSVDDDGDVDLDDQIEGLKEDFPELFTAKGRPPVVRRAGQDGKARDGKSVDQRFADKLMKSAGYR